MTLSPSSRKPAKSSTIRLRLNGRPWRIEFKRIPPRDNAWAFTYHEERRIVVDPRTPREKLAEVLIDEITHVHFWCLDNDAVAPFASDAADVLRRLGVAT